MWPQFKYELILTCLKSSQKVLFEIWYKCSTESFSLYIYYIQCILLIKCPEFLVSLPCLHYCSSSAHLGPTAGQMESK